MTKIINIADIAFGRYVVGKRLRRTSLIKNVGTEKVVITAIASTNPAFESDYAGTLQAKYPISSTLYFGANGRIKDANGSFYLTDQGYGTLGTTDSNGVLTVAHSIPSITALTTDPETPEPATNFELSGESTYLVGKELTLQYSTDDSTWLPLGVATVQPDGTWSKADCQIATAGTYYLRAIYGAEIVESASITVTVESGVTHFESITSTMEFGEHANLDGGEFESIKTTVEFEDYIP